MLYGIPHSRENHCAQRKDLDRADRGDRSAAIADMPRRLAVAMCKSGMNSMLWSF